MASVRRLPVGSLRPASLAGARHPCRASAPDVARSLGSSPAVNADLNLPEFADEILPVFHPDSIEANGSDT